MESQLNTDISFVLFIVIISLYIPVYSKIMETPLNTDTSICPVYNPRIIKYSLLKANEALQFYSLLFFFFLSSSS